MLNVVTLLHIRKEDVDIDINEALRYVGCNSPDASKNLADTASIALEGLRSAMRPKVCYMETPVSITGESIEFSCLSMKSRHLARSLCGCSRAYLFAATCGPFVDREIARRLKISLLDGLVYDAMGSAAIEGLCDAVCEAFAKMEQESHSGIVCPISLRARFSPGYGDLALETQIGLVNVLDTNRKIGLSLTDGMMMSPMKSVSAIVGVPDILEPSDRTASKMPSSLKCNSCTMADCAFRIKATADITGT